MNDKQNDKLYFVSDYMEGAHPLILEKLAETNMMHSAGYGCDEFSEEARNKIRAACKAPDAEVYFLIGGTQTNATMIDAILKPYQGVVAADTGHISVHEAGAIEYGGHKVLQIPQVNGKLTEDDVRKLLKAYWNDPSCEHIVMPGMVYISQPTECGTLYSLAELKALSALCKEYEIPLYMDGARLAYALACPENNVTLPDIAELCDAFYIGGTKCGALFGEAVVTKKGLVPHLFTIIKQHGALLAKGRISGVQFGTLFTDDLYFKLGKNAIDAASKIRTALKAKGYEFYMENPTNQIFVVLGPDKLEELTAKVEMDWWEKRDDGSAVMRIATSWATQGDDVDKLITLL